MSLESFSYPKTTEKEERDEKRGGPDDAGKVKVDQHDSKAAPENAESPEDRKARESSEALDKDSQKLYANSKVEKMPGGTTYSREAEKLSGVGQESAEASLAEMQTSKNWATATPEVRQSIEKNYQTLELDFMKKLDGIKAKYAAEPNQEAYARELFDAQKQFQKDLGEVAADANGRINGIPASKTAADAKERSDRDAVAKKEQKRFEESMQNMMKTEALLKTAEINNKRLNEQQNEIAAVVNGMDTYFAHTAKKSEKPAEQLAAK